MIFTNRESVPIIPIWTTIRSFSEIKIKPNTIVLCDIDDTLLHHPAFNHNWITLIHTLFYEYYSSLGDASDRYKAEIDARQFCDEVLSTVPIRHTDRPGFFAMVSESTTFAFITARQLESKDFTYDNLRSIDVDPEQYKVHFSGHSAKGEYIRSHFNLSKYEHVVFIDDQARNLTNVYDIITHRGLELYQFTREIYVSSVEYYPFPPLFYGQFWFDGTNLHKLDESSQ